MRSPESTVKTQRFFARCNAPQAQANYAGNQMQYSAACFKWDMAHADATPTERDAAHRVIAKCWHI